MVTAAVAVPAAERALSPETYTALNGARQLADEGDHGAAARRLEALAEAVADRSFEAGVVAEHLAHAYAQLGRNGAARSAADRALAAEGLTEASRRRLWRLRGELALRQADFAPALADLERWLAAGDRADAQVLYRAGYAAYRLQRHGAAIEYLERAVQAGGDAPRGAAPLLVNAYLVTERYGEAVALLRALIAGEPQRADYWERLAEVELRRGNEGGALAAWRLAEEQGLGDADTRLRIVRLEARLGAPERAARRLEGWLREGLVPARIEHSRLLARLWRSARERDQAISVLTSLTDTAPESGDLALLGRLHLERGDWAAAQQALSAALSRGGLAETAEVQLLLGIAALEAGDRRTARTALSAATRAGPVAGQARAWLSRLE
jgi:tetratricopeptide (TPR) repeat protein